MRRNAVLLGLLVAVAVLLVLLVGADPEGRAERRFTPRNDRPSDGRPQGGGDSPTDPEERDAAGGSTPPVEWAGGPMRIVTGEAPDMGGDPGSLRDQRIPSESDVVVTGTLVDLDGDPIRNRRLRILREGRKVSEARVDGRGNFEIVSDGVPFDIVFATEKRLAMAWAVKPGRRDIELIARPKRFDRTLRVKVCLPEGTPAKSASVSLEFPLYWIGTDPEGVAVFEGLPSLCVSIVVAPPLSREDLVKSRPRAVFPEGQEIVIIVPAAARIPGRVLLADGSVARRVTVWAVDSTLRRFSRDIRYPGGGLRRYNATTDDRGRFTLKVPVDEPGPWTLEVFDMNVRERGELQGVRVGDYDVVLNLQPLTSRK